MHACSAGSFIGRSELHISPMPFGHLFGWVSAAGKLLIQRRQVAMLSAERRICPGARAGGRREKGHALGVVVRPGSRDFSSSRTSSVCVRWAQLEPGAGRCGSIGAWLATPHHSTAPRWCGVVTRAGWPAVAMPRASSPIDSIPARAARPASRTHTGDRVLACMPRARAGDGAEESACRPCACVCDGCVTLS